MASKAEIREHVFKEIRKYVFLAYRAERKGARLSFEDFENKFHRYAKLLPDSMSESDMLGIIEKEYSDVPSSFDSALSKAAEAFSNTKKISGYLNARGDAGDVRYRVYLNANPFHIDKVLLAAKSIMESSPHILFMKFHYDFLDFYYIKHLQHSMAFNIDMSKVKGYVSENSRSSAPVFFSNTGMGNYAFQSWLSRNHGIQYPVLGEDGIVRNQRQDDVVRHHRAQTLLELTKIVLYFDGDKDAMRSAVKTLQQLPKDWFGRHTAGLTRKVSKGIGFCKQLLTNDHIAQSMGRTLTFRFLNAVSSELNEHRNKDWGLKKLSKSQLEKIAKKVYNRLHKELLKEVYNL
ncbi:MAG: hypothetical protein ABIF92_01645 [archaeon]